LQEVKKTITLLIRIVSIKRNVKQMATMNMATLNGHEQEAICRRWNWLTPARRQELYYRHMDCLDRLFNRLGLTAMCTHCGAVMPAGPFTHRHPCPECGRQEIATPYGG